MKGLKLFVFAVFTSLMVVLNVKALDVANLGELKTCLETANNECNLTATINVSSDETIDLNGGSITGLDSVDPLFYINNGSLKVNGTGSITANKDAFFVEGNRTPSGAKIKAEVEIGSNVKVVSNTANCIYIRGNGAKADVYGSLESKGSYAVIQGNGTKTTSIDNGNTVINIYAGAKVYNKNAHAIYHPQSGKLTISGGTIEGTTGIEMRAGELVVTGGTITGTASTTTVTPNGNGTSVYGAGIALAQHTTILEAKVNITGGNIKGATALYEATPETPNDSSIITINVNGGNFEGTNGDAIHSDNKTNFVTSGTFNKNLDETLLKSGVVTKEENGVYLTGKENKVIISTPTNGKVTADKTVAIAGETITLTITPDEGYEIDKVTVEDAQGSTIKVTNNKFTMGKYDTGVVVTFKKVANTNEEIPAIPEVPKTFDNITTYIVLGIFSILASLKITTELKRNIAK